MTTDLDALYQEIILDHYKNPHHKGLREPFEAEVHHVNPTCGDEVTLRVHLADGPAGAYLQSAFCRHDVRRRSFPSRQRRRGSCQGSQRHSDQVGGGMRRGQGRQMVR